MPVVDGRWVVPDRALLKAAPGTSNLPPPTKGRGGVDLWNVGDIRRLVDTPIHQICTARGIAMDIEQHAVEVSGSAEVALQSLKASLDKFKSTLANDLTSIKAASSRVQTECTQMKQAYAAAQAMLIGADFEKAVENAERMAVALKSISELSETKLSVAVFSGGKPAN